MQLSVGEWLRRAGVPYGGKLTLMGVSSYWVP